MERLDHTRTVAAALVQLGDAGIDGIGTDHVGLSRKVDALVDGYLITFNTSARETAAKRKVLADEFLAHAPFTELSYRVWRRIMRDDTDLPEPMLRVTSASLLPDVDFPRPAAVIRQHAAAMPRLRESGKVRRSFFGLGK
jgi:hypothetical protein